MTPHRPSRRSILATLAAGLALALAPGIARADVVFEAPPALDVRPVESSYTMAPTSVEVTVTNGTGRAIEARGVRLIVLTGGVRVPLRVTGLEVDGRRVGVWDAITFAPGAPVRVRLSFESAPASALAMGRIDFALRLGHAAESTFTLVRADR